MFKELNNFRLTGMEEGVIIKIIEEIYKESDVLINITMKELYFMIFYYYKKDIDND